MRPVYRNFRQLAASLTPSRLLPAVGWGSLGYALLTILLALAWWWLAGIYGRRPESLRGYVVWSRSQIAKYLPGNVLHYFSRQVLGRQVGVGHEALLASGLLEMVSLMLAASLLALFGALQASSAAWRDWHVILLALGLVLAGLFAWPALEALLRRVPYFSGRMQALPKMSLRAAAKLLLPAVTAHFAFFTGTGALLWWLGLKLSPATPRAFFPFLWAYALAWMAGTITPGAPGGLGVREAVLALQLGPMLGQPQAAMLALALRLVTVSGDVLTAGAGWLFHFLRPNLPGEPRENPEGG